MASHFSPDQWNQINALLTEADSPANRRAASDARELAAFGLPERRAGSPS